MKEQLNGATVRSAREYFSSNEAYLQQEHVTYAAAKERAMRALEAAAGSEELSEADRVMAFEQRMALLKAEAAAAKGRDARAVVAQKIRALADQIENPGRGISQEYGDKILSTEDEIVQIELLLLELRGARERRIEDFRQIIDLTSDQEVIKECCAMLEEHIASCSAAGDLERARRATASLMAVRELVKVQEPEEVEYESTDVEEAKALAAILVGQRDIRPEDSAWAIHAAGRYLKEYRDAGATRADRVIRSVLTEYYQRDRSATARRPVDQGTAFKGAYRWS